MKRGPIKTTLNQIVEWWKENYKTCWPDLNQAIDWAEPVCWSCGWWKDGTDSWKEHGLQRSHLIAHACGGADHPSNLVMLCDKCNMELMPNFDNREQAILWCRIAVEPYNPMWAVRRCEHLAKRLEQIGIVGEDDMINVLRKIKVLPETTSSS